MNTPLSLRSPCPPGACICERDALLLNDQADLRILRLSRAEEKRLVQRLENLESLADLQRMVQRMEAQLGLRLHIAPSPNEVRTMRGIAIVIEELPGLCRRTRQAIAAAIRRALEKRPEIAWKLLDANDLLRDT